MLKQLINFDRQFFRLINSTWHNNLFDAVMPVVRIPVFWVPLYLFLFVFILANVKKHAGWLILFAIVTVALTDQVSSTLIKHNIHRLRPCADEAIAAWRRALIGCPINSSFTSSHAANHFGMAVFFYFTLKDYCGKYIYLFFFWAALVCYAQVYVGVHYPFDIIGGTIVGAVIGTFTAYCFRRIIGRLDERKTRQKTALE